MLFKEGIRIFPLEYSWTNPWGIKLSFTTYGWAVSAFLLENINQYTYGPCLWLARRFNPYINQNTYKPCLWLARRFDSSITQCTWPQDTVTVQHSDRKSQSLDGKTARILFFMRQVFLPEKSVGQPPTHGAPRRVWGSYPHMVPFAFHL